jgi:hypothetical protein
MKIPPIQRQRHIENLENQLEAATTDEDKIKISKIIVRDKSIIESPNA